MHLARLMGPEGFSRTVAVKQLHAQFARDPEFVAMFLDEARLASRVRHPNVVSPLDVISCPPELFIVMEYVHGEPLSRLLKRLSAPVPGRVAVAIFGQILLGLHAAHDATGEGGEPLELVHRDISPQNIMVTQDGVARIVDFGIAKARARSHQTDPGKLKGKLGYMAPEQVNLQTVDRRADVFAVGVVLWEALTGRRLFSGETPAAAVQNLLHGEIEPPSRLVPDLPPAIDQVVLRALARDPGERFESARAMAEVLEQAIAPCSTLELASWVESLVGEELSARAELLLEVEGLSFADFTSAMPHPLSPSEAEAPRLRAPGADTPIRPTGSVNGSAGSEDAGRRLLRKGWLVPVLVAVAAAFFVLWGRTRGTPPETAPAISRQALPLTPLSVNASLRTDLGAAQPEPPAATEAVSAVVSAAPRKNARTSASARPKPVSNCDVPYVIDSNGVKRFKEACF